MEARGRSLLPVVVVVVGVVVGLVVVAGVARADPIDTASSWNGTSSISPFNGGSGWRRAFGQTVTVGSDSVLDSFSLHVEGYGATFTGYVMAWDDDHVTGSVM